MPEPKRRCPRRLQQSRARGWRKPANSVCVGRPTKWGNPFSSAPAFRAWLERDEIALSELLDQSLFPWTPESKQRLDAKRARILAELPELRGLDLLCWCRLENDCHADVYHDLANRESEAV